MSSLVRRLAIRMMQRAGYSREKWIIVARPGQEQKVVNVKRGGEITDPDDNPIGREWPVLIPARAKAETRPVKRRKGAAVGRRRGKRGKNWMKHRRGGMTHNNVTPLHRGVIIAPADYPVGIRFVPHVPVPTPMFTGDELLWSCFFSGVGGALITVGLAFVWSFFL